MRPNNTNVNAYGDVIMTTANARVHLTQHHVDANPQTKPTGWAVGCYRPHPTSPFIIITQSERRRSFYCPREGEKPSRPYCGKGVQPYPGLYIAWVSWQTQPIVMRFDRWISYERQDDVLVRLACFVSSGWTRVLREREACCRVAGCRIWRQPIAPCWRCLRLPCERWCRRADTDVLPPQPTPSPQLQRRQNVAY